MKPLLTTCIAFFITLLFCATNTFAQDYIRFKSGDIINCKIVAADKNEVVFVKDSLQKKAPMHLIEELKYNATTVEATSSQKPEGAIMVPTPQQYSAAIYPDNSKMKEAKTCFALAATGGGLLIGLAIVDVAIPEPEVPSLEGKTTAEQIKLSNEYAQKSKEYTNTKQALNTTMFITAGVSIIAAAVGAHKVLTIMEDNKKSLSLYQKNAGIGLCLRF